MSVVRMIHSVGDYVAGEEHDLDDETSDRFVILGYAEGKLSRDYTPEETEGLVGVNQTVGV